MSIKVGQAFERTSAQPIDVTLTLTKADMLTINDNLMPAYYFTICQDDGKIYLYDKTATASVTTGKFKKFDGGSGGGAEIYDTTDTLSPEINGTKVVLAADLPGVSFSDLVVGSSIIKDAKGTLGIVTTITGTTSVTVTTATTSTPTMELTQAQYDALTPAQQNNGTIYFVTDSQPNGGTCMGAYDTIYSTTERVIGSYMGKPLYQKTLVQVLPTIETTGTQVVFTGVPADIDMLIDAEGTGHYRSPHAHCGLANQWMGNYSSVETTIIVPNTSDGNFVIQLRSNNAALSGQTYYITIRYTKTTDTTSPVGYATPNDYSTSEKIVGTWIDGKAIYQKTFVTTLPDAETFGTVVYKKIETGAQIETLVDQKGKFNTPSNGLWHDAVLDIDLGNNWNYAVKALVYDNNASSENANRIMLGNADTAWNSAPVHITIKYTKVSN